jgi:hypothetical protein
VGEEHAEAGLELLQLAAGGALTLGEPEQVLAALQHDGTEGQARSHRPLGIDGHRPASRLTKRKKGLRKAMPVHPAMLDALQGRKRQGGGDEEGVEQADVVGGEHELAVEGHRGEISDLQAEEGPGQETVEMIEAGGEGELEWVERVERGAAARR